MFNLIKLFNCCWRNVEIFTHFKRSLCIYTKLLVVIKEYVQLYYINESLFSSINHLQLDYQVMIQMIFEDLGLDFSWVLVTTTH